LNPSGISGEEIVVSHVSPSKLKSEPIDLMMPQSRDPLATGGEAYHQAAELKPLGLKVDSHHPLLQQQQHQQQQQYIVLAYNNDGVGQAGSKSQNVTVDGFDLKEEKVSV
jgi:hypothetical protein